MQSDKDVIKAAKIAHTHNFISKLQKGYNTMVIGDGKILESADYKALMEKKGHYFEIVISQMEKIKVGNEEIIY